MQNKNIHKALNYLIALVWVLNGFFCKVLNLVPRHQLIVSAILGKEHAWLFTKLIGFAEIIMALWILSAIRPRLNANVQIVIVLAMNIIEFSLVPGLLLFGRINLLIALIFVTIIYFNEFRLNKSSE